MIAPFERFLRGYNASSTTLDQHPGMCIGNCLSPDLPAGSLYWLDYGVVPAVGDIVGADVGAEKMLKRLGVINGQRVLTSKAPPILVTPQFKLFMVVRIEYYGVDYHEEQSREVDAFTDRLNAAYALQVAAAQRGQRIDRVSLRDLL